MKEIGRVIRSRWDEARSHRKKRREFRSNFELFVRLSSQDNRHFVVDWNDALPCLDDAGRLQFDRHYVYSCAWAARILKATNPSEHIDISSSLYFSSIVSAFLPVRFFEYRQVELGLSGLTSGIADLTKLPFPNLSIPSLSCMHVVEHIGLGRYGDPIAPQGDLLAMKELHRVLAPRGSLLFVVPIGRPRVVFNAHRIYCCEQILEAFAGLKLKQFRLIPDSADAIIVGNASKELANSQSYGCGCFWFQSQEN